MRLVIFFAFILLPLTALSVSTPAKLNPFANNPVVISVEGEKSPIEFYTDDEKSIRFEIRFSSNEMSKLSSNSDSGFNLVLVQVGPDYLIERYFGVLNDQGVMGDRKSADGVYSRKVQFKERKPRSLQFAVFFDDGNSGVHRGDVIPEQHRIPLQQSVSFNIKARPNFIDVMGEIWKKLTGKS
jgi:hypothetical protein